MGEGATDIEEDAMTDEQRARLAELVRKHPHMRISTLLAKINADIRVNQLRAEMGYRRRPAAYDAGASEGLS